MVKIKIQGKSPFYYSEYTTLFSRIKRCLIKGIIDYQKGKCGLCESKLLTEDALLDHNHIDDTVRGALCYKCNALLGILESRIVKWKESRRYELDELGDTAFYRENKINVREIIRKNVEKYKTNKMIIEIKSVIFELEIINGEI